MNTSTLVRRSLLGLGFSLLSLSAQAAKTDISNLPMVVATPNTVQPNLMFVLDDSGSMGFDFMPDHVAGNGTAPANYPKQCRSTGGNAGNSGSFNTTCCQGGDSSNVCLSGSAPNFDNKRAHPPFLSASFNTMAYNPATLYKPPIGANGIAWADMTKGNTSDWTAVPNDAYRQQSTATTNLLTQFPDVMWCTDATQQDCLRNGNYLLPGTVNGKNYTRYYAVSATGEGHKAIGSPSNPSIDAKQKWGPHYYKIVPSEYCTKPDLRNCQVNETATYKYPAPLRWCDSVNSAAAAVSNGTCQAVRTATYTHARYPTRHLLAGGVYPGRFERVDILPGGSYPKSAARTDCGGDAVTTCNYEQEMTNFANWWAYYRTRMQMMKSSTSHAFGAVGDDYRVGYLSINNAKGNDFLNLKTFSEADKTTWYSRLFGAKPSGATPLRAALHTVGRLYAGARTGTLNGSTIVDPVQYSCQGNFTLLSTDGFWNETVTLNKLDGTAMGDQDGNLDRPMKDGNATPNTLADVASYYFRTDLRNGTTVEQCKSGSGTQADVCSNGERGDKPQKMVTFTLGLGASGYMQYLPGYAGATEGDYHAVATGATASPATGVCSWQGGGQCNWPIPSSNTLTTIDDLWHAAVNGGGSYFSAVDPDSLYTGLTTALAEIEEKSGTSAGASASNPNITANDNQLFVSNFRAPEWTGELSEQRIDPGEGTLTNGWSAAALLDARASRTIYMFDSVTKTRKNFEWASLNGAEKAYFEEGKMRENGDLSQFCNLGAHCIPATDRPAARGEALLNFVRGERINEGPLIRAQATDALKYYRVRKHVLGDIVNSEAVYVQKPQLDLSDAGYTVFKERTANRPGMIYVGANDGMLHAFNASTGQEAWAYVPTAVLPKLYKLADKKYANKHEFFVDSTPVVEDVFVGGQWRSLLIGGLGAGGRAYYAIDVTDPADPKPLWEFSHDNLGYTFGKAEIGKMAGVGWVVLVASGYNNVVPGDGVGRLFVLDAATGRPVSALPDGIKTRAGGADVGSVLTPSGLGHIRTWVDNAYRDSTILRVYGGDALGNLWRFDLTNTIGASGYDAQRLATLKNDAGIAQPVTSRPEVGEVQDTAGYNHAMVFVGTGRYMGVSDINDRTVQSIYGIKDRLSDADFYDPRNPANAFVKQTLTDSTCPKDSGICTLGARTRSNNSPLPVDLAVNNGWYVDLPQTLERVNTDPVLVQGVLAVTSNVVDASGVCTVGGSSWLNYFDYRSGKAPENTNNVVSIFLGEALATRPTVLRLSDKLVTKIQLTDGRMAEAPQPKRTRNLPADRISWRELSVE